MRGRSAKVGLVLNRFNQPLPGAPRLLRVLPELATRKGVQALA
jgi:hypothetical protein